MGQCRECKYFVHEQYAGWCVRKNRAVRITGECTSFKKFKGWGPKNVQN